MYVTVMTIKLFIIKSIGIIKLNHIGKTGIITIISFSIPSPGQFSSALTRHCTAAADLPHRIALIMYAESCSALVNLPAICAAAADLSRSSPGCLFEPAGLVFGSDDFCASLGATRTDDALEVLYARQRVVLVAKAFGLQVGLNARSLKVTLSHVRSVRLYTNMHPFYFPLFLWLIINLQLSLINI